MDLGFIILIIALGLVLGGVIFMLIYTLPISKRVYFTQLVRTDKEKWGRVCSAPENQEQQAMWDAGIVWADKHQDKKQDVHIENDGFNLYGEYYDFHKDRCVIILPGRCESLVYSYFFAPPYEQAGFNVLVVDTRCHGKSDGKYNTIGVKESGDVLAWAEYMNTSFNQKEIYFHGICIGTASAIFALSDKGCPYYVKGLVTEGCFVSFRETFKRHMMADKRPLFPVLDLVMLHINHHTKTNVYTQKPIRAIKQIKKDARVLFLYGEKDIFSIPKKSQQLFNACAAADKKLVWFKKGGHSHLRINNTDSYDNAIIDFFKE
ncbi:MAG: alpha/beta hydrolase [Clostridia bacterium]|nr:alpha/beta hydrolase [Clostridia bacterium]